jgi:YidC/Oxa1 family membrane protein insertase
VDNRRLLMATLLSAAILILWTFAFPPPPPPAPEAPAAAAGSPEAARAAEPGSPAAPPSGSPSGAAAPPESGAPPSQPAQQFSLGEGTVAAAEEKTVVLENDKVRIEIKNRGAQIVSARLKTHLNAKGQPLDLVRARGQDPYPLAILGEGGRSKALNEELFQVEEKTEDGLPAAIFRHQSDKGVAEKRFALDKDGFLDVEIRTAGLGQWGMLLGPGVEDIVDTSSTAVRSVGIRRGEVDEEIHAGDVGEAQRADIATASWLSLEDNFFFAAFIPEKGVTGASLRPVWVRPTAEPGQPRFLAAETAEKDLSKEILVVAEANQDTIEGKLYFGAKQFSYLQTLPYGLEHTVRWGWLFFLAKPLYLLLEWVHSTVVPNYGWAIVIVTFLIKLAFFPLTWKSSKAMTKMQELAPKMNAIRARYRPKLKNKDGKPNFEAQRQMNDEVMALYRQAGTNPASGCLPILLQMPVFFAFYKLLTLAVELRQAPWILWIRDLSVADPFYVLPLVMGVTSVILQKMSPPPPDPMQAKMLQILPIVFTVFAFAFPSGLVVYWVTNNLLTMVQQALILKSNKKTAPVPNAA